MQKLATLDAKRAGPGYTEGVGQVKDYSQRLKARFAFASNGIGWYEIDVKTGIERDVSPPFPTPDKLP